MSDETTTCQHTAGCILTFEHESCDCFTDWDTYHQKPKPPPPTAPASVVRHWMSYVWAEARRNAATKEMERLGAEFVVCRECETSRWERGGKDCKCIPF